MAERGRSLLLLRHGPTAWNAAGRIQGRQDLPLSEAGRVALAARRAPSPWHGGEWHASPLVRAVQSVRALGGPAPRLEPRLAEMDWGGFEGRTLAALRGELGAALAANEARGLDFRPDGGESPREVRARLADWLADLDPRGPPLVAVTHKGVIRAALSLATGWDMCAGYPVRLDWACGHAFRVRAGGGLAVERLNVPLDPVAA